VDFSIDIQRAGKAFGVKGRFVDMAHIFTSLFFLDCGSQMNEMTAK